MKCTACGNENQPGAKFCVHCGVVLSLTAPASAIAPAASAALGSTSTGQRPVLAPQSVPVAAQTGTRPVAPAAPLASPATATAAPSQPAPPAAAQTSVRTLGFAAAGVALLVVLGAGGYFGYRMLAGEASKQATASVEPAKTETPASAPATEPARDAAVQEAPATGAAATAGSQPGSTAAGQVAPGAPTAAAPSMSASPPLPGQPATGPDGTPAKAAIAKAPKAAPAQPVQTPPGAGAATPPAGAPTPAATKAPPQKNVTAQVDRWQMYADEMAQCAKEDFFSRLGCQQRTRARYCDGYWGKVPQCPAAPSADHGQ